MDKHDLTVFAWEEILDIKYWIPSHGTEKAEKALAEGKKAVFLGACNCGCWTEDHNRKAREMAATFGDDGPVFHNLKSLDEGRPVILLPKALRGRGGSYCAISLPWIPETGLG